LSSFDWFILIGTLVFIVSYGTWKSRGSKNIDEYLLADRSMRWYMILFSMMATQASAITFLSTPGQAYVDGMRFVQFYFGLPIAMVILSVTAVPIYHRLKVYTAYEYLENRFDIKTRSLAALLFLTQRGLAAGLTIFAPALILSVLLGWNLHITILIIGVLVMIYTVSGGAKAVSWTHFQQMLVIFVGMIIALFMILRLLPQDVSFVDALHVAGKMGKLNAIDFEFDLNNRYNIWSGILGGLFLQLSYFGTDQSQVQRYLTGSSVAESRLGLLMNGIVKIPMQFFILFIGAMVFVFYQFQTPPMHFNSVETTKVKQSQYAEQYYELEEEYLDVIQDKNHQIKNLVESFHSKDQEQTAELQTKLDNIRAQELEIRDQAKEIIVQNNPKADPKDTNYIFLTFVTNFLPIGVVGLILAMIFSASMSSTSAELNALASTTVIDIYKRMIKKDGSDKHYLMVSKIATLGWGLYAILLAETASRLGSLIEAVNILGSLFYGTILGIFLVAFYVKKVKGTATFIAALIAEVIVFYCFFFTEISFLWYNVVGCLGVIFMAVILNIFLDKKPKMVAA
jgi:solute:Na+ symporter, SSS family